MIRLENVFYDDFIPNWRKSRIKSVRYVVIFVVHGSFLFQLNDNELELTKGDVLFIRPGTFRSGTNGPHPPHQKFVAHFLLDPASLALLSPYAQANGYELIKSNKAEYLRQRFHMLYQNWFNKSEFHEFICHGIMTEMLGLLMQEAGQKNVPSHRLRVARKIEHFILEHYKEEITISQLCELVHLSPNYVISIFKEVYRHTPIEFVHQVRISVAHDLLLHSDMNVAEISNYLGYCDPTYFNRMFKKIIGKPPSALAKERKSEFAAARKNTTIAP